MDLASPLKPDVFRVSMVILLPGWLATFPWLAWFYWPVLLDATYWQSNGVEAGLFIVAIALIAGMVLEDIAAHIEVNYIDPYVCRAKGIAPAEFERQWMMYLVTTGAEKYVAQRYLRAMVTRFKFELSMIPACCSAALALCKSLIEGGGFSVPRTILFIVVTLGLAYFFLDQARKGGWQLHELRVAICRAEST